MTDRAINANDAGRAIDAAASSTPKFCSNCGTPIAPGAKFCRECGTPVRVAAQPVQQPAPQQAASQPSAYQPVQQPAYQAAPQPVAPQPAPAQPTGGRVGWSTRFDSPEFQEAMAKAKKSNKRFAKYFILAPAILLPIYGLVVEGSDKFLTYLGIGFGVTLLFSLFFVFGIIKDAREKPWVGTVVDKLERKKIQRNQEGRDEYEEWIPYGVLVIKDDNGKKHKIEERMTDARAYHYFKLGDRIRFHAKCNLYFPWEKYDKSKDTYVYCPFCGRKAPINESKCPKCGNPLLN